MYDWTISRDVYRDGSNWIGAVASVAGDFVYEDTDEPTSADWAAAVGGTVLDALADGEHPMTWENVRNMYLTAANDLDTDWLLDHTGMEAIAAACEAVYGTEA